jgi:hypothetical protein
MTRLFKVLIKIPTPSSVVIVLKEAEVPLASLMSLRTDT